MKSLYYLIKLLRYRWWLYAGTLCASLILYTLGIVPALIARRIFDSLTDSAQLSVDLWSMVVLLVMTTVVRQTLYVIQVVGRATDSYVMGGVVRSNLLQYILSHPSASAVPISSGEAISRFRDDIQGLTGFIGSAYHFLSSMAFGLVAVFVMWGINPTITSTVFAPLVLVTIIINQSRTRVIRYRENSQNATSRVTGMLGEIFSGIQVLKLHDAEGHALERLQQLNREREGAAVQDRMFSELLDTISSNLSDIGAGLILLLVGQAMQSGSFTVGDFALFVYMLPWVSTFTSAFGGVLAGYRRFQVSWGRLASLLDGEDPERLTHPHIIALRADIPVGSYKTTQEGATSVAPRADVLSNPSILYEARGLSYIYPNSQNGIHAVDLQLPQGSITVITGRIGSGKSTLLRVLLGLLPKEAGGIYWHGQLVTEPSTFFVPPRTAYTPQTPSLFSDSLRENILMGLGTMPDGNSTNIDSALQDAIHAAVLAEDINRLEQGLDTVVGPRGVRLSGGQVLRSAAARMFVRQPELLVFDDLSSALDVETEHLLWERLFGYRDRQDGVQPPTTCLIVSHRQSALRHADNIVVLKEGQVIDSGHLEELLQRSEEMQQLWLGNHEGA